MPPPDRRPRSEPAPSRAAYPETPDGRYFVVRGRLWRRSNPALGEATRQGLVTELMSARRGVRSAMGDGGDLAGARRRVDAAKQAVGERGPPWWTDGAPDYNRRMVVATPYAEWFASLSDKGGADRA